MRALVFDVFVTLVDWRSGIADAFRSCGVPDDAEQLADGWRARFWPMTAEVNEGRRPWGNFDDLHLAALAALLSERGLDLAPREQRGIVSAWHRLAPWPDVREGLQALRRELIIGALSNGHLALLVDLTRHGDLRFDCLISADLVRAYKPAADVYRVAPALLGLEPADIMLVAAHPLDLVAARRSGLRTAFVDGPLEYGANSPPRRSRR